MSPQFGMLQIRVRIQKLTLKIRTARRLRCPTVSLEEKRENLVKDLSEALNRLVEVRSCPARYFSPVFCVPGNCILYENAFLVFQRLSLEMSPVTLKQPRRRGRTPRAFGPGLLQTHRGLRRGTRDNHSLFLITKKNFWGMMPGQRFLAHQLMNWSLQSGPRYLSMA